ncbi:MAG: SagB/ThcOx family dehydrogenase [Chromatiaceae bacterium]|nr:SagB/ThcOx family dehydrogenase [Chromatiaceae bacterium]
MMNPVDLEKLRLVRDYHERTKHRPERYAPSLGYMDWANQPNPFRSFAGTEQIDLPHPALLTTPTYDSLFSNSPAASPLDADLVGRLFFHSLALSAWKQVPGGNAWSLRINPSSGNLHPTEAYLIAGSIPGLVDEPGVFHYAPFHHRLERRCRLSEPHWADLTEGMPAPCLLVALTSIYWRESWKYGERAFRYCNHDVGHAIGAIAIATRTLGWEARIVENLADEELSRLIGIHLQLGTEAEHADCLLALYPRGPVPETPQIPDLPPEQWRNRMPNVSFVGEPNALSRDHHDWPVIEQVSQAVRRGRSVRHSEPVASAHGTSTQNPLIGDRGQPAERIVRQRRSAVDMDGTTSLDRTTFYQILLRTLPGQFPFKTLTWSPRVALAIFVHRIDNLAPGLYFLVRSPLHEDALRESLKSEFEWHRPAGCPEGLRLYRLLAGDASRVAKLISCNQDIAGDGVFSLGMLAELESALAADGPDFYPRLFWETGLIGQVLYLEAEAAGIRATGIGCFFDDTMHELLGIRDRSWQSLYHFTLGGPVEDTRLKTIAPYGHIHDRL